MLALADHSDYEFEDIADDTEGRSEAFTDGIADDTLTAAGKPALEAGVAQVAATRTAAQGRGHRCRRRRGLPGRR